MNQFSEPKNFTPPPDHLWSSSLSVISSSGCGAASHAAGRDDVRNTDPWAPGVLERTFGLNSVIWTSVCGPAFTWTSCLDQYFYCTSSYLDLCLCGPVFICNPSHENAPPPHLWTRPLMPALGHQMSESWLPTDAAHLRLVVPRERVSGYCAEDLPNIDFFLMRK